MSYEVQFKGGQPSIVIENEKGLKLWDMWFAGTYKNMPVDAGDNQAFLVGDIKRMIKIQPPGFSDPWASEKNMIAGRICVGKNSIQREINNIASAEKNPMKLIRNTKWREKTRMKLRVASDNWCDYRENECVCEVK